MGFKVTLFKSLIIWNNIGELESYKHKLYPMAILLNQFIPIDCLC